MLCQKCKKNQANFYYKQTINGKTTQIALCEDCAAQSGIDFGFGFGNSFMPGLFGSVFGALSDGGFEYAPAREHVEEKRCPLCGSTFGDITRVGKVGCAKCYETFSPELAGTIEGIHGNVKHIGRRPKKHA
jgi:Uncharacterized protein with conserved CXXC pairs